MPLRALLRFAIAEMRRARAPLAVCILSIVVGVGSLTAVQSIVADLRASIAGQTKTLLGADLAIEGNEPLDTPAAAAMTAELADAGARSAELTEFYTMLRTGADSGGQRQTQLVRARAVTGDYPFYGEIDTEPAASFAKLASGPYIIVAPKVLRDLEIEVGDRIRIGETELLVLAALHPSPGSPSSGIGFAPAVYFHAQHLEATRLLQHGSRIRYTRLFATGGDLDVEAFKDRHWQSAVDANLSIKTARESAASIQRFLHRLSHYLTIIGLITLLLGALGIAASMSVFARSKLDNAAVFRCLGATPAQVFAIYTTVALLVGVLGSALGTLIGSSIPYLLSAFAGSLGAELLPTEVQFDADLQAIWHGFSAGVVATLVFTLAPIYRTSSVTPLRVLRRGDGQGFGRRTWAQRGVSVLIGAAIAGFVLLLSVTETESFSIAFLFTGSVAISIAALAILAHLAMFLSRRAARRLPSYHVRQGLSNLYRPGNQTASVLTAIGVGMLLIGSILIIEGSLQDVIAVEDREDLPNTFVIDIQEDQLESTRSELVGAGAEHIDIAPMVAARISHLNGTAIDKSGLQRNAARRSFDDTLRTREYFVSYRQNTVDSESVVEGTFWAGRPAEQEVSIDERLAENLEAELGDLLTLDIQGLPLEARITSFRRIRWQAMRPNAMIVLSPGLIEEAPKMFVVSFRVKDDEARFRLQARLADLHPNLSIVDITEAAANVRHIMGRISMILTLLAVLTLLAGAIILTGAIAASQFARIREAMLLKVLGASSSDLRRILVAEFAALALLGVLGGWLLAEIVNRLVLDQMFMIEAAVPYASLAVAAGGIALVNVALGLFVSRGTARRSPMEVLKSD